MQDQRNVQAEVTAVPKILTSVTPKWELPPGGLLNLKEFRELYVRFVKPFIPQEDDEVEEELPENPNLAAGEDVISVCLYCVSMDKSDDICRSHTELTIDKKVSCPFLRAYNCNMCNNNGGDYAHIEPHCPKKN